MSEPRLSDLDLAALLCSRVCHDLISPVGAIANGLELHDDPDMDEATRRTALDMVRSAARTAAAKLTFCRIAFGASGTAGTSIDMTEAAATAKAFLGAEKASLDWQLPAENRPKQHVKLLLNMVLMVLAAMPRGGVITVTAQGEGFAARAKGERARVPAAVAQVLDGIADLASLDARLVQPYYTRLLAAATGLTLAMAMDGDDVVVIASRGGTSS